ncbi:non-homologous end-joining DNA ligase [Kyrpidia spormannii]|uniref:DNA polymerase domain-containing protein n=2 Tax=Kyrpidia spormannii TaxID=2055160 RepID=A0ACA8Z934_9BACL|nr:non-homologous end-joining DNA ligase [Kyrpidia spormannii]CAB3392144.1 DNA polymerase domain-containing protein [Kyrpidia spormannii]CAB3393064.1 DNA polymerase domain-containing protein [Kyrpidia spormannii]
MKKVLPQNLGKVLWPGGFTKGDLLEYLATVATVMIPHLKDRPVTVIRYPDGIEEEGFFQKHPPPGTPDWVTRVTIGEGEAIVIDRLETLLWLGQLGAIEYHVTFSRFPAVDRPTYLVFDLDPSVEGFAAVCRVALMIRDVLTRLGLPSYPKTSGATGIQVYVPIHGSVTFEQTRPLMRTIAKYCEHRAPELITTERRVRARGNRVYIDYLQHAPNKTLIAPYSPRAVPTAAVSAPLQWGEVERGMAPENWTIATMAKRLQKMGDLFAPVLDPGVDIRPLLQHLDELSSKRSP